MNLDCVCCISDEFGEFGTKLANFRKLWSLWGGGFTGEQFDGLQHHGATDDGVGGGDGRHDVPRDGLDVELAAAGQQTWRPSTPRKAA